MTIQQAIQKAIEGGWEYWRGEIPSVTGHGDLFVDEKMVLDPLFWQALGKAMGWKDVRIPRHLDDVDGRLQIGWLYYWHYFIDNLAEGGSIKTYFEKL